jgi:hypothetical protein
MYHELPHMPILRFKRGEIFGHEFNELKSVKFVQFVALILVWIQGETMIAAETGVKLPV